MCLDVAGIAIITQLQQIEKSYGHTGFQSTVLGNKDFRRNREIEQFTRISPWRCLSIELKESTISNSDILDMRSCMSAFILACLQSLCCSCSTTVRRL